MSMPAIMFTFDDSPEFEGFAHGSTWNGFDNVAVTVEEREKIADWFRSNATRYDVDDEQGIADLLAIEPMAINGLISLGWGYATQIVKHKQSWRTEFPDMTDMPALPEGFEDSSWHNDACPSYTSGVLGLSIWIDYPKIEDRECGAPTRFSVQEMKRDGSVSDRTVLHTDDWAAVLHAVEAQRICTVWTMVLGLGFHPDTPGDQYVIGGGVWDQDDAIDPNWALSGKQAREYEADMARLFEITSDPYEYGVRALRVAGLIEEEAMQHKCKDCGKLFATGRDFEAHDCVTKLSKLSLAELEAMIVARLKDKP